MSLFPTDDELQEVLVGPDSVSWAVASDIRLYAAMLYPLLLQVAHPTVGAGVRDYSDFERRPWDRLMRSLDWVTLLVYGGGDAVAAGRRLRSTRASAASARTAGATTRSSPGPTPGSTRPCLSPTSLGTRTSAGR